MLPDTEALARFGIEVESERGALLREGGFRVIDRYDGHRPPGPESGYAAFLRARGYDSADPWSDYVIGVDDGGRIASGWQLRNVHLPSRVAEPHSETAYMTDLALDWIRAQGEKPWVLHLSYVKPHWPYSRRRRSTRCFAPPPSVRCSMDRRTAPRTSTRSFARTANTTSA